MRVACVLALCLAAVAAVAVPHKQRIVGGSEITIDQYSSIAALLYSSNYIVYEQRCGGIIINARSILTAAHCPFGDMVNRWRVRVGSNYSSSGGTVHLIQTYIIHYNYNYWTADNDIAIMRTASVITYGSNVHAGRFAGANYNLLDNEAVWAAGWGATTGPNSEQLRHVQVWTVNQAICAERYASIGEGVTGNMLCAGWLDVGGRDQCSGDAGGPLYHNGVVVGIASWGKECALAAYPRVNVRVSRFTDWIINNA